MVDKQLELEKVIGKEAEKFKATVNELAKAFENDTGVYLKKIISELCFSSITVEIDFEETKRRRKMKDER